MYVFCRCVRHDLNIHPHMLHSQEPARQSTRQDRTAERTTAHNSTPQHSPLSAAGTTARHSKALSQLLAATLRLQVTRRSAPQRTAARHSTALSQLLATTLRLYPSSVFCSSIAIVIGPTPPGTGVIWLATSAASLKATSPTSRYLAAVDNTTQLSTQTDQTSPKLIQTSTNGWSRSQKHTA